MAVQQSDPRLGAVAIIGSGVTGLITAHTLIQDGFTDVEILTRDSRIGGTWADNRIYPGLRINNVHGEYRLSPLRMPLQSTSTGGRPDTRLTGEHMCQYMKEFASKFIQGKARIRYGVDVRHARRDASGSRWLLDIYDETTSAQVTKEYARIVLCTGGTNTPKIPENLSPSAALEAGFKGMAFHSRDFREKMDDLLATVPPADADCDSSASLPVVVIGGGKSAQDICAYLANEGRKVTIVCPHFDTFVASSKPLPSFIRKSRFLSMISPHIHLRTWLERFLHTTWVGKKVVDFLWHNMKQTSFQAMGIPTDSPLWNSVSLFWRVCTNDEGEPRQNGFHPLAVAGKIEIVCPGRVAGYGTDGRSVILEDGRTLPASAVILATGYKSSWTDAFEAKTLDDLALSPQPAETMPSNHKWDYTTLSNPPPLHPDAKRWSSTVYRAIVPAKNITRRDLAVNGATLSTNLGYTCEVTAHWISSYFLGDDMRLPLTVEDALSETAREAAWMKARYPEVPTSSNGSLMTFLTFWSWPQYNDDLLEDMGLPVMRSGGNALTWPFQVIDLDEIRDLKKERDTLRGARA